MSVLLVSAAHIDALLSYAGLKAGPLANGGIAPMSLEVPGDCTIDGKPLILDFADPEHCTEAGRILLTANADAIAARTGADSPDASEAFRAADSYEFRRFPGPCSAELMPKRIIAAGCFFEYQAREVASYRMSLAEWLVAAIICRAAKELRDTESQAHIFSNPTRGPTESQTWQQLAPAPEPTAEPENDSRAKLLAKLRGTAGDGPAIPLGDGTEPTATPEPTPEPATGPKPEPETTALVAAKLTTLASDPKPTKGPAKPKGTSSAGKLARRSTARKSGRKAQSKAAATASPPAAAATGRKGKAPQPA